MTGEAMGDYGYKLSRASTATKREGGVGVAVFDVSPFRGSGNLSCRLGRGRLSGACRRETGRVNHSRHDGGLRCTNPTYAAGKG